MKSRTLLLFSGLLVLGACKQNNTTQEKNTKWLPDVTNDDHGPLKVKEFGGDFDEIEVSQSIDAEVIKSDVEKIVISAPANIIEEILVENSNGKVHIHYKSGIRVMNTSKVTAKIYAKDFIKLKANSSASIRIKDKFIQDKTDLEASSSGSLVGNLEANKLDISVDSSGSFEGEIWAVDLQTEANSSGSITITGKSKNANADSSSSGSISAKNVLVENVTADASSSGSVEISASHTAQAEATSSGTVSIFKKGNLSMIKKEESSGGSVTVQ